MNGHLEKSFQFRIQWNQGWELSGNGRDIPKEYVGDEYSVLKKIRWLFPPATLPKQGKLFEIPFADKKRLRETKKQKRIFQQSLLQQMESAHNWKSEDDISESFSERTRWVDKQRKAESRRSKTKIRERVQ